MSQLAAIVKMVDMAPRLLSVALIGTAEMVSQPAAVIGAEWVALWSVAATVAGAENSVCTSTT